MLHRDWSSLDAYSTPVPSLSDIWATEEDVRPLAVFRANFKIRDFRTSDEQDRIRVTFGAGGDTSPGQTQEVLRTPEQELFHDELDKDERDFFIEQTGRLKKMHLLSTCLEAWRGEVLMGEEEMPEVVTLKPYQRLKVNEANGAGGILGGASM